MGCKKIFDFSPKSFSLSVFKMAGNFGIGEIQCHDHVISTKFSESPVTELVNQKRKDNSRQAEDHIFYQPHVHPLWFIMFEDSTKKLPTRRHPRLVRSSVMSFGKCATPQSCRLFCISRAPVKFCEEMGLPHFGFLFVLIFFFFGRLTGSPLYSSPPARVACAAAGCRCDPGRWRC